MLDEGETRQDGTIMSSVRDKFFEPENLSSFSELGFPANGLGVRFTEVEKPSGVVISGTSHETSSKTGKIINIW